MSNRNARRVWKPADTQRIVPESMNSKARLAAIRRREGLSPHRVYQWRKALLSSAEQVFARRQGIWSYKRRDSHERREEREWQAQTQGL